MSSRSCFKTILWSLAALGAAANAARATTIEGMSLRELVASAPTVVRGTVTGSSSHWNADRSLIVTDVRIRVLEVLKGRPASEVVVTQPGGQVGKLRVDVDGAEAYPAGREMVLFLRATPGGMNHVIGLSRGRFDVIVDARTGRKTVRGLDAAAARTGTAPSGAGSVGGPVPLDEFLGGLKALVRDVDAKGGK
jgi:hypothetical protein